LNSNKIVKSGWGNRSNFQASYGLKLTPDDIEEGKAILKAFEKADRETAKEQAAGESSS
jgi:hypothetical protein